MENQEFEYRLKQLLFLKTNDQLSPTDKAELEELSHFVPGLSCYVEQFDRAYEESEIESIKHSEASKEIIWHNVLNKYHAKRSFRLYKKIAVAAGIAATASVLIISLTNNTKHSSVVAEQAIIAPIDGKAVLKLSNGKKITLGEKNTDSSTLLENGSKIVQLNAELIYKDDQPKNSVIAYNTVATPKNVIFKIMLSDRTKVWLNSNSSITFPTNFQGNERKVTVTGEVYFEVAKDPKRNFIVSADNLNVQVLGTIFDLNSSNTIHKAVTLLNGSTFNCCQWSRYW